MRRKFVLIASVAISACTIPAVASECTSNKGIDASRTRWATLRSHAAHTTDNEETCRTTLPHFTSL
jgi:hypothetical protein